MAKKKAAVKQKAAAAKPGALAVTVDVQATPNTPMYYANHAEVSHSRHEFVLAIVRVPTKFSAERLAELGKDRRLVIEPEAQVTIPPTLLRPLIKALEAQIEKYEGLFGKLQDEGPKDGS